MVLRFLCRTLLSLAAITFLLLAPSALCQSTAAPGFALHDGDRVVFYGDSITAQRLYTRFTEEFIVSRYPQLHIHFYNAGVGGDTVDGGYAGDREVRLQRDVYPRHPTVVTIMLGMNDGRYTTADFDKNLAVYEAGYRKLVASLKANIPGVRIFLICPSPYDEIAHASEIPGYNSVMVRYGDFLRELGRKENLAVIDFNVAVTDVLRKAVSVDKIAAGSLLPDRIHPSPFGHWVMAAALAKGWGVDPIVSRVVIDGARGSLAAQGNTSVTELRATAGTLSWTQMDGALPLPLELNDTMTRFLLQVSAVGALDQQLLQITGLTAARYELLIDGKKTGSFSAGELAQGVNLAVENTPMEQAAKPIDWTADDRGKLNGTELDLHTAAKPIADKAQAIAALEELDQQLIEQEYKAAQPKPHQFQLVAVP